ncbi:hypothetical protein [Viridibacterium curvum]|uniref:Cytochrome c domain-containing protein n=1 Tax=Viridibacterium curvum TaxID=1101404 RepID=A0ABP9QSS3_9RHOO
MSLKPLIVSLAVLFLPLASQAQTEARPAPDPQIEAAVKALAQQLANDCPYADAGDQAAFDRCRQRMFGDSALRRTLSSFTLWGRVKDPDATLKSTSLTQFAPDVLTGMYLPLFMFDGKYTLTWNEREKLWLARLNTNFRNRLQPGQFPYPFWHVDDKWGTYENARSVLFWINPQTQRITVAQFSRLGDGPVRSAADKAQLPAFDGKWMWTDAHGRAQPATSLFDGLFRNDNPYKAQLAESYRDFALSLRDGQCLACHSPDNSSGMKRLVLLQTPAHAAAEIKRVLRDVERDAMPRDDFDVEKPLDPAMKKVFLEKGTAFSRVVDQAREWERNYQARTAGTSSNPQ